VGQTLDDRTRFCGQQARLKLVYAMQTRMDPDWKKWNRHSSNLNRNACTANLPAPKPRTNAVVTIGDCLAVIGDTRVGVGVKDGMPEIAWVKVQGTDGEKRWIINKFGTARIGDICRA
jgi:hypothetical protein